MGVICIRFVYCYFIIKEITKTIYRYLKTLNAK